MAQLYLLVGLSRGADNESELHELCSEGRIPLSVLVDYTFLGPSNVTLEQVINYHVALKMRSSLASEVKLKAVELHQGIVNYGRLADRVVNALAEEGVFVVYNVYDKQQFDHFAVDLERIVMNEGRVIDSRERAVKGDYVVTVSKSDKYSCGVSADVIPINSVGMVIEMPFNNPDHVVVKDLVTDHSLKLQHDEYKVLRKVNCEPSFFMFKSNDLVTYRDYRGKELIGKVKSVDVREEQCSVDFKKLGDRVVDADELTLENSAEVSFRHKVFVAQCEERKVSVRKAIVKAKDLAEKLARDYDVDAYIDRTVNRLTSLGVSKPVQQEFLRSSFISVRSKINLCKDLHFEIDDLSDYVNDAVLANSIDVDVRRLFSTRMENIVFKTTRDSDTFVKNFVHNFMNSFWVVEGHVGIGDFVEYGEKPEGKSLEVVTHLCYKGMELRTAHGNIHIPGSIKTSFRKKRDIDYLLRVGDRVRIVEHSSHYGKAFDEGVVLEVDLPSVSVKFGDNEYSLRCYDLERKPTLNDNKIYDESKKNVSELVQPFAEYVWQRAAAARSERRRLCSRAIMDLSSLGFVDSDFKNLILNRLRYKEDVKDLFV